MRQEGNAPSYSKIGGRIEPTVKHDIGSLTGYYISCPDPRMSNRIRGLGTLGLAALGGSVRTEQGLPKPHLAGSYG